VGLSDEVDGISALVLVDIADRAEVLRGLHAALKIRRRDRAAFDALFARLWSGEDAQAVKAESRHPAPVNPRQAPPLPLGRRDSDERGQEKRGTDAADVLGYSPEVLLRRKPFDECSAADLAAIEKILARLALRLAVRRSRRLVPTRTRGVADLRRSFRRAIGTGGELLSLARRERAVEQPQLVVLCDTSGSMDPHARFLLAFVLSLRRVARRTEVFAFNTSLTRLTPWLSPGRIRPALDRLAAAVPDWSGGTRIGESLAAFVEEHLNDMVDARTVVVILSDGLDRGDTTLLEGAMRAIRAEAKKVIWLNPLMGDSRYEPEARGMRAALPFVDHLAPAHNIESLERLLPMLA
jgi:uncharacterized protein with von Willebrand factor type A (vWA) domain